jgi:hypothetical protein
MVPLGVVEAVNGNIKSPLWRGRGYKNLHNLLLKAQRLAATKTEFVCFPESRLKWVLIEFSTQYFWNVFAILLKGLAPSHGVN